jgi:oligoendopeptidase F
MYRIDFVLVVLCERGFTMHSVKHTIIYGFLVLALLMPVTVNAEGKMSNATLTRKDIAIQYVWDLTHLFSSLKSWERELVSLEEAVEEIKTCKGALGTGTDKLAGCLTQRFDILKRFGKLYSYASRVYHIDLKQSDGAALYDRIGKAGTKIEATLSFFEPEILTIPAKTLMEFQKDPKLGEFAQYLYNTTRRRQHIRSDAVETVIAQAGDMAAGATKVYQTLATVNVPWPEITLNDGSKMKVDQAGYGKLRYLPDRDDRLLVFKAFWNRMTEYKETLAGLLATKVNTDHFYAVARGYDGDLESALDSTDVPTSLYHNMITQIRTGLPVLHRYLDLRKKVLKVDTLGYHDLYTSIIPNVDMPFTYDDASAQILEALKVLGGEYTAILENGYKERWADVYPTDGKRTGAYSSGSAYDTHPFILLNYTNDYNSMSTTAHEFGHALHSFFANKYQPFAKADYPIFVAEVASTVNENLLFLHMVKAEKDPQKKLFLLGQALENYRTTVFRQALFAEFELRVHEMAQAGKSLTADAMNELYLTLLKEYYGEDDGHIEIDPLYAVEWAYIPHFYYNFYMFQYTTSFVAATSIARKIYGGDSKARDNYLAMLKAGGSKTPVGLLSMAGVDMSGAEPYEAAFKVMTEILDEIEDLL